jgi:hypothetical protein
MFQEVRHRTARRRHRTSGQDGRTDWDYHQLLTACETTSTPQPLMQLPFSEPVQMLTDSGILPLTYAF